jgi:6-phosphogluconolactonase
MSALPNLPDVYVSPNPLALANEAAGRFVASALEAMSERGRFIVALSGGSTPKTTMQLLAELPYRDEIDWSRVHVAWGDERCVPPDDERSNFRLAREALLDKVPIPPAQIYRMPGERHDYNAATGAYEATLRNLFALGPVEQPRFDLIHLGLGTNGHTASLFPGSPALDERERLVAAPWVEEVGMRRLTLTPPVINAAREVVFLVAGEEKAAVVHEVLRGPRDPAQLPAQLIAPTEGRLTWLLDAAAAARLTEG